LTGTPSNSSSTYLIPSYIQLSFWSMTQPATQSKWFPGVYSIPDTGGSPLQEQVKKCPLGIGKSMRPNGPRVA